MFNTLGLHFSLKSDNFSPILMSKVTHDKVYLEFFNTHNFNPLLKELYCGK